MIGLVSILLFIQISHGFLIESNGELGQDLSVMLDSQYSFYVFASEWAGSVCSYYDCLENYLQQIDPQFFNIHGLWPTLHNGASPDNDCLTLPFSANDIGEPTNNQLQSKWSGLYADSTSFHEHEWEKHGRCWNQDAVGFLSSANPINEFFSSVVDLAQKLDIYTALYRGGIIPDLVRQYNISEVQTALQATFKIEYAVINCEYNGNQQYLDSIYLCLDLNYDVVDCPQETITQDDDQRCRDMFIYPPIRLSY